MSPVLLTGGAGFVGSHIVDALLAAGTDVRVLDVLLPMAHDGVPADLNPGAELVVGDVRDRTAVADALNGVTAVCHQAAMVGLGVGVADLPGYVGCNDLGTAVLLAEMASAGIDRLVLASSMVVYGEGCYRCPRHGFLAPPLRRVEDLDDGRFEPLCPTCGDGLEPIPVPEDAALDPRSGYAATKVAQEHLAAVWARVTGGTATALRYHNVYGPRMPRDTPYAGVASLFRSALEGGGVPRVFEDGRQRRDFIHVRDVARANLLALHAPARGGVLTAYNVASGTPRTVGDLACELCAGWAGRSPMVTGEYRLGDVRHVIGAPDRARVELGFTAEVDFSAGVRDFARAPLRAPAVRRR